MDAPYSARSQRHHHVTARRWGFGEPQPAQQSKWKRAKHVEFSSHECQVLDMKTASRPWTPSLAVCGLASALVASGCTFDSSQLRALGPDGGLGGATAGAGGQGGIARWAPRE
jgi:hypothetical protein